MHKGEHSSLVLGQAQAMLQYVFFPSYLQLVISDGITGKYTAEISENLQQDSSTPRTPVRLSYTK